jgi:hypothetical protein
MENGGTIMRNDFKMIVFKQLTISIKTHDNKINVSCSANQQNVTLLNMTINTNSPKFSHELWHFTPQVQKRHDYVIKRTRKSIKNQFLFSNRGYNMTKIHTTVIR